MDRQIFLRDVLTVLFKRKAFILGFTIAVVVLVLVGNLVWPPTYESMAKVQITRGRETVAPDPSVLDAAFATIPLSMSQHDVNTIIDLVYSNDVLRRTVEAAGLDDGAAGGILPAVRDAVQRVQYALRFKRPPDPVQAAVESLRRNIEVEPVPDSYTLELRMRLADGETAQAVLEELIEQFQDQHKQVFSTQELGKYFDEQITRVREQLTAAQDALRTFKNENNVVSLDVERDLLVEQFAQARRLLNQLTETEAAAQAVGDTQADTALVAALSKKTESTVVTELQLRLLDKIVDRNNMLTSLGAKHPRVIGIQNEIEQLTERLREAIAATRAVTQENMTQLQAQMTGVNDQLGQLENLQGEVSMLADSLEYFRKRQEEAVVYDEMAKQGISSIRITSQPTRPDNPVSPRKLFNLVLALIGGGIGGVAIAFFLEYLDHGLKTPEDVEFHLGIPPLASYFRGSGDDLDPAASRRLIALIDSAAEKEQQMVAVASSDPGEGALPVARAMAEAQADDPERRTLLLDFRGDGRQAAPHGPGALDILDGAARLEDVINRSGSLYVIGRGSSEQTPVYRWRSDAMRDLLTRLRQDYDRIIVHVPPILQSHDALHLLRHADGLVLVIRADSTRREVVQRAVEILGDRADKILGAVLTDRRQVIPEAVYRRI
jgi:uncharacterized protein involved in exopolysaccharide biosynthesis